MKYLTCYVSVRHSNLHDTDNSDSLLLTFFRTICYETSTAYFWYGLYAVYGKAINCRPTVPSDFPDISRFRFRNLLGTDSHTARTVRMQRQKDKTFPHFQDWVILRGLVSLAEYDKWWTSFNDYGTVMIWEKTLSFWYLNAREVFCYLSSI